MKHVILPFIISWIAGLLLVPLVRKASLKLGLVDRPGGRKIHSSPIPRVGGVALYIAAVIGALPFLIENTRTFGILIAGTFVFLIGLLDDIVDVSPMVKLAGQILACIILLFFGVKIEFVTNYISGEGMVALGLLTYPITVIWIIGLTNTINIVDGVDGLAGGIVFIALGTLLSVRLVTPMVQDVEIMRNVLVLSASIMGAIFAFLKYNFYPASIFMGDSGAYFLGFMIAALSVAGAAKDSVFFPLTVPLIAFGLPVLDVIFAILRRFFNRVPIVQADKGHLHHRLLQKGFSQKETTRFLWMVSTCFGFIALLSSNIAHRGVHSFAAICLVIMICLCILFFLNKGNGNKQR